MTDLSDDATANPDSRNTFEDVVARRYSRRAVLGGTLATAATFLAAGPAGALPQAGRSGQPLIDFEPIPLHFGDRAAISPDYEFSILIPWGTPIDSSGPAFSWPPTSAADQEAQIGIGHDGMWFFAENGSNDSGWLCINHEFGRTSHVLGKALPDSLEDVRIMQAAHGNSVVKIARRGDGTWGVVDDSANRRITVNTPVTFSGPAAGSPLLDNPAGNPLAGTLNNCANGYTPWGTYLTCEENFNGYFGSTGGWTPSEEQARYGFTDVGFGYAWHLFDPRFDLASSDYANEGNRFGWIVEYDPRDPDAPPVKRTALGRAKHEGCALTIGRGGRAVAYMGDDQRFDYIYKFVSASNYKSMLARGMSPLDHGVLYAARFDDDGTGEWVELSLDNPAVAARFSSQDDVVVNARIAADLAGATPMDRPEWTTVAPDGTVYCTLTNNSRRTEPNAANPLAPNFNGHIIRWTDDQRHVGTTFEWDIFIFSDDTVGTGYDFGSPDGLWADPFGRLFIETDGAQPTGANDQMLVADPDTGDIRRIFAGVERCEITGVAVTPDQRTMFINVQHPGNGDPAVTRFPDFDPSLPPRDCTVVITRKDGGVVGS
jgi:secreted PhoX family phosphatase